DLVEAEIIPRTRRQGVEFNHLIGARSQTDEPGDHQVAKGGVVVVLSSFRDHKTALFEERPSDPITGHRVKVLVNPRHDPTIIKFEMVGMGIDFQQRGIVIPADTVLVVVIEQIGQSAKRDRGCIWPAWTVPLAFVALIGHGEFRAALFGSRWTKGGKES